MKKLVQSLQVWSYQMLIREIVLAGQREREYIMKATFRLLVLFVLVSVLLLTTLSASAATINLNGFVGPGDSQMPVVFISTPTCAGQGATLVYYEAHKFTVDTDGVYTFSATSAPTDIAVYLMNAGFTPAAAFGNCLAASNTGPNNQFTYALTAGTIYYMVIIDDTFDQLGANYSATISGPGEIILGGGGGDAEAELVPGCDVTITIPDTAVGATITANTPVYWKPGEMTDETLPAGLNVRAIGVDESGMYTKVLYVCGYYWVPTSNIGPNFDAVWNGAPLPTGVVN